MTVKDDTLIKIATIREKDLDQVYGLGIDELRGSEELIGWYGYTSMVLVRRHEVLYRVSLEAWMSFKHLYSAEYEELSKAGFGPNLGQEEYARRNDEFQEAKRKSLMKFRESHQQLFLRW